MRGEIDPEMAAKEYENILPDRLDFVWLGLGTNGHVASLFPHHCALRETSRRVLAVTVEAEAPKRITLTLPSINNAREIQVLVTGSAKTAILEQALYGPSDPETYPCQLVHPNGPLTWLVDGAAAGHFQTPRAERSCVK